MTHQIISSIVVLGALVGCGSAYAQKQPTVSDIATCNNEADAAASAPSALPAPGGNARVSPVPAPAPPSGTVGGSTDSTGQIITNPADPRLEGLTAARASDPVFRATYRRCMARLGY
jgi:hypothetical protein